MSASASNKTNAQHNLHTKDSMFFSDNEVTKTVERYEKSISD
jgi:hypothetical protein